MKLSSALVTAAAIAAVFLLARRANAAPGATIVFGPMQDAEPELPNAADVDAGGVLDWLDGGLVDWYAGAGGAADLDARNLPAFLFAIRNAEHYPVDVLTGMDYQTFYGGAKFHDLSDHPVITGELRGVKLPDRFCSAAGLSPGCVSTAAGAYQFTRPTWTRLRERSPRLPDFSPESQNEAARRLLAELGVPAKLRAGDFSGAVARAARVWASLPGSSAQQGGKSLAFLQSKFVEAGGMA